MKRHVAAAVQVTGIGALIGAGWTINETVALAVAGAALVLFGIGLERTN